MADEMDVNVILKNLTEAGATIKALNEQMTASKELEKQLHKILKLRASIEKLEQVPQPYNVKYCLDDEVEEIWACMSRFNKLFDFFNYPDYYDEYDDFLKSVDAITDCSWKSTELVFEMLKVLDAHILTYVKDRRIDQPLFKDECLIKLAECFDKLEILTRKY